jgi:hypothetical protein
VVMREGCSCREVYVCVCVCGEREREREVRQTLMTESQRSFMAGGWGVHPICHVHEPGFGG